MNSKNLKDMMEATCPDRKEETFKLKKKVKCFSDLEPAKFHDEQNYKDIFTEPSWEEDRNKLNFYGGDLTPEHIEMMDKLLEVNNVMENICQNSKERCEFCQIMNTSQKPFIKKSFQATIFEHDEHQFQRTPQWLIDIGEVQLCTEC